MTDPTTFEFDEIFASVGVLGHTFSDRIAALDGRRVRMRGYLAPAGHGHGHGHSHDHSHGHDHDRGGSGVLVLTRAPVAPCPDCGGEHDYPDDAVFVFPAGGERPHFAAGRETEVEGILEHGSLALPGGGTSFVRLRDARWTEA